MVSTRELSDAQDLSVELGRILQKYRFPSSLLDKFPSTRLDLSNLSDPLLIQEALERQNEQRQEQIARWERNVQPSDTDWAGMIEDLQPLLSLSDQRNREGLHPSSTGIMRQLSYHRFDGPSKLKVNGDHAYGLVTTFVDDEDVKSEIHAEAIGPGKFFAWAKGRLRKTSLPQGRIRQSMEKISLVRESEGWELDSVPFR